MNYKKWACSGLCLAMLLAVGCGQDKKVENNANAFARVKDAAGNTVVLEKAPERVVSMGPSLMSLIDAVDGKIVGRCTTRVANIPESMKNVPELGETTNINTESVIALKPDLVIGLKNQHSKYAKVFEGNKINFVLLQPKTYKEVKETLVLLGDIYGKQAKAKETIDKLDADIKSITSKIPKEKHRVVIMFASAKNVTVQGTESIAGSVCDILDFDVVTKKSAKADKTPYSMEALLEANPEHIFVVTMGKPQEIEARLKKDFKDNPAWASLDAVKKNRVHVLPEELFLVNPGIKYPKAVEYMAKLIYPEEMKDAK